MSALVLSGNYLRASVGGRVVPWRLDKPGQLKTATLAVEV